MAGVSYIENGSIKPITGIRVGVNGTARFVKKGWVGVNGVAQLCYYQELVAIPVLSGTYTYDGTEKTVTITNLDTDKVTVSGTLKATNAGTYQVTVSLKSRLTAWEDGTQENKIMSWTIDRMTLPIPSVSGTYTYNGSPQTVTVINFDSERMTQEGATATDAGTYTVSFYLKNTNNYQWSDGTTTVKSSSWTINIADGVISPTESTYTTTANRGEWITIAIVTTNINSDDIYKSGFDHKYMSKASWNERTKSSNYRTDIQIYYNPEVDSPGQVTGYATVFLNDSKHNVREVHCKVNFNFRLN